MYCGLCSCSSRAARKAGKRSRVSLSSYGWVNIHTSSEIVPLATDVIVGCGDHRGWFFRLDLVELGI